jgi:rhodanese-related sulfurtransferase
MLNRMFPGMVAVALMLLVLGVWHSRQPGLEAAIQQASEPQNPGHTQIDNAQIDNTIEKQNPVEKQAVNILDQQLTPAQYQTQFLAPARPHLLIDVRTPEEFKSGHIPGAINIELDTLASRIREIPQDRPIVLYCRSGRRSEMAAEILGHFGYSQVTDLGGIIDWQRQGLPIQ